jgi:hypothetical protein
MTVLDLVGMLAFLGAIVFLAGAFGVLLFALARRRWHRMRRLALAIGAFLAIYAAALLLASLLSHDRLLGLDQRRCFDDWCVAVAGAQRATAAGDTSAGGDLVVITLRVSSQAKRITQRPSQPHFWVEDAQGRQYAVSPQGQATWDRTHGPIRPVDDRIGPGESFTTPLVFAVPPAADHPALIVTEGPGWLGRLIIGSEESPLHKRTKFPLQAP